jgi:hypothetical protein
MQQQLLMQQQQRPRLSTWKQVDKSAPDADRDESEKLQRKQKEMQRNYG